MTPLARKSLELGIRHADLAEDFVGVLAEERRRAVDRAGRLAQFHRQAEQAHVPIVGCGRSTTISRC